MNYRTKNRRFLLKATLGATTLVMAGCSSSSSVLGSSPGVLDGSTPEGGGDAQVAPCPQGCGTIANPPDGGEPADTGAPPPGLVAHPPDGGEDAGPVCGGGVCGSITNPPDASDQ
jgi:hypothetical protein